MNFFITITMMPNLLVLVDNESQLGDSSAPSARFSIHGSFAFTSGEKKGVLTTP